MNKQFLYLDFETYYDSKQSYTLRKQSILEYVRSSQYKTLGLGYALDNGKVDWVSQKYVHAFLTAIDWSRTVLVCQNTKFDGFILHEIYKKIPAQYIDTLAMSRAVLGKTIKSHSLATLAEHFGLEAKGFLNTDGKWDLTIDEEKALADYCRHDVELCRTIYLRLAEDFPESQYPLLDQTIRMFVEPKLKLNVPMLQNASVEEAKRRADIFKEIGIDKSEFSSNVKFPILLQKYGYEVPMKESPRKMQEDGITPVMIPALALGDVDFLEMLEGQDEKLKMLCEARVAAKSTLLETRSAKMAKIGSMGLWSFDVEFSGADQTHRFSGGSGAGGNPQNFTRNSALRTAVEAPDNYELVVGDFSNIEMRLVAYLSKDPGLIEAIETGKDIYCDFASVFYGRTITKENKDERRFGKTAILGLGYGMGWNKFIRTVRTQTGQTLTEEDSRKAVDIYRTRYAQVPLLWYRLDGLIKILFGEVNPAIMPWNFPVGFAKQMILLPSGLPIRFPNLRQEQGEGKYVEWVYDIYKKGKLEKSKLYGGKMLENICQGLAGELCKTAMLAMGQDVVGQCHDELLVLCRRGLGHMTAAKLKRAMSVSPSWLPEIKLDAEVKVGSNWGIK